MAGKIDETINGAKPVTDIPNGNNNIDAVGLSGIKIISMNFLYKFNQIIMFFYKISLN